MSRVALRRLHLRPEGNAARGDPNRIGGRHHAGDEPRPVPHRVAPGGAGEGNQVEASTARRPPGLRGSQPPIASSAAKKLRQEAAGGVFRKRLDPQHPRFEAAEAPIEPYCSTSPLPAIVVIVPEGFTLRMRWLR